MMPGSSSKSPDTLDEETAWWVGTACELDDPVDHIQSKIFFFKLGRKPLKHLVEISIFLLNNVTVRPTKIMKRAYKSWAHFQK